VRMCAHCAVPLDGRRRQARYCGGPCRAAASRARAAESTEPVAAAVEPNSDRESAQKRTQRAAARSEWQVATRAEEILAEHLRQQYPELWEVA
jgi:hypothetical protein